MCQYSKSCADEIDFTEVGQLHSAALQISKTCFDFKKLCVSFLGVTTAFLIKFAETTVDHSLFIVGLTLILGFWISDATAYFYQKRLRLKIKSLLITIAIRNNTQFTPATGITSVWQSYSMRQCLYIIFCLCFSLEDG